MAIAFGDTGSDLQGRVEISRFLPAGSRVRRVRHRQCLEADRVGQAEPVFTFAVKRDSVRSMIARSERFSALARELGEVAQCVSEQALVSARPRELGRAGVGPLRIVAAAFRVLPTCLVKCCLDGIVHNGSAKTNEALAPSLCNVRFPPKTDTGP